jgi:hypothetical protein
LALLSLRNSPHAWDPNLQVNRIIIKARDMPVKIAVVFLIMLEKNTANFLQLKIRVPPILRD